MQFVMVTHPTDDMPEPIVFVSYSHDTPNHKDWVLRLATELRALGIDTILDQWGSGARRRHRRLHGAIDRAGRSCSALSAPSSTYRAQTLGKVALATNGL
ncbi:MAG: toll/interleukin-1 receptor domain-containing protein [Gemmatimonadaceae bacterium]|nr:toll/interleukin-1 receptor domain-containing protein [Gemmatimonadaceae bacterium]